MRSHRWLWLAILILLIHVAPLRGEIVPKSPEEMQRMATHVVVGKVRGIYTSPRKAGNYAQTHYVAELAIDKVEKGDGLKDGQLVYVRYWTQNWVGGGLPPPGTIGHRGLPSVGDTARVYLVNKGYDGGGNVGDGGFNVVFANGFDIQKAAKAQ